MNSLSFSDLKIEDISGAIFYDSIDLKDKAPTLQKVLRELSADLRKDYGWVNSRTEMKDLLDPSTLAESRSGESVKLAAALAGARDRSTTEFWRLTTKCDNPQFKLEVGPEAAHFLFDRVEKPTESRKALEKILKAVIKGLQLVDLQKFGAKFRHIFRLKPNAKNYDLLNDTLLPGLTKNADGHYSFLGEDHDFRRADLSFVYYRANGELITQVELEAPGNEDNTTLWLAVDTQTAGEIQQKSIVNDLSSYFDYYETLVSTLLAKTLTKDVLDTSRGEMMSHRWFKQRASEK